MIMMNYRKRVPSVPTRSQSNSDSGNVEITPVESPNVTNVPNVPNEVEIHIQETVCVHEGSALKYTHHTNVSKGGVHVPKSGNVGTLENLQVVESVPTTGNVWERVRTQSGNIAKPEHYVNYVEKLLVQAISQNISFRFVNGRLESDAIGEVVDKIMQEYMNAPSTVASIMTTFDARYRTILTAMQQPNVYSDATKIKISSLAKSFGIDLEWTYLPLDAKKAVPA